MEKNNPFREDTKLTYHRPFHPLDLWTFVWFGNDADQYTTTLTNIENGKVYIGVGSTPDESRERAYAQVPKAMKDSPEVRDEET